MVFAPLCKRLLTIMGGGINDVLPLRVELQDALFTKFLIVVSATVKDDILVAVLQGALGGAAFSVVGIHAALLWAVLMAFLSLIPAIGSEPAWFPVACYFL